MKYRTEIAALIAGMISSSVAASEVGFGCSRGLPGSHWECDANGQFCQCVKDPPGTICFATSRGPDCHVALPGELPPPALCLDGEAHVVPCSTVIPSAATRCRMAVEWNLADPDHPSVVELTPVCADEADVAASQTVTKIIKLGK